MTELMTRLKDNGAIIPSIAKVAGVTQYRVGKLRKAAQDGDCLASFLLLWAADEVSRTRTGFGVQTDLTDFC